MIKIIRFGKPEGKPRKRYEPTPIWWLGLTKAQRERYLLALDKLDKGAIKRDSDYRIKGA